MAKRRRILHKLRIDEISGVDSPAVEGALVTLMKRADDDPEKEQPMMDFDAHVSEIAKREHCSTTQAMKLARKQHPEAFAAYQAHPPDPPVRKRAAVSKPTLDFMRAVADIRKRDNCSHVTAMSRARKEHRDLFDQYQGG